MNKHSAQSDQHWPPYTASRNWDTFFLTAAIIPTSRTKPSKKPCQNSQICTKQVLPCQPLLSNRSSCWSIFMPVVRLTCKFWISSGGWQAMNKALCPVCQKWRRDRDTYSLAGNNQAPRLSPVLQRLHFRRVESTKAKTN